jgi:long-chain acyl-CoA synthetase
MEKTLAQVFRRVAQSHPNRPAVKSRIGNSFHPLSYGELYDKVMEVGTGLISLGIKKGDKVGLISDNRPEWLICDLACVCMGTPDVPRGSDITSQEIEYILGHSNSVATFVENESVLKKVLSLRQQLPDIRVFIVMDPVFAGRSPEGVYRLEEVAVLGRKALEGGDTGFEIALESTASEDMATLIYTSGTTGEPKGVMLSNRNLMQNIEAIPPLLEITEEDCFLSILPPWHVFERMVEYVTLASGACTAYTNIRTLAADMTMVKPTMFGSVPRIWEGIYSKVIAKIEKEGGSKKRIFNFLVGISKKYVLAMKVLQGRDPLYSSPSVAARAAAVFRSLVTVLVLYPFYTFAQKKFTPIRAKTGGALRAGVSGGGALPPYVDEFFAAVGITLLEGYGLTETSPVLALRTFKRYVLGTVGPPIPGTEIRIVDSGGEEVPPGEKGLVKCRGPQIMMGYYKNPEGTATVIDGEGWFDTGDLGRMTTRGELSLTGRAKETIVLLGGENVEPSPIEESLKESPLIVQVLVVGQDKKSLGALVVPDYAALGERSGHKGSEPSELCANEAAQDHIRDEIQRLICETAGFKAFEKVNRFQLLPQEFTVGKELTLTMKMRRNVIAELYADRIEAMYG